MGLIPICFPLALLLIWRLLPCAGSWRWLPARFLPGQKQGRLFPVAQGSPWVLASWVQLGWVRSGGALGSAAGNLSVILLFLPCGTVLRLAGVPAALAWWVFLSQIAQERQHFALGSVLSPCTPLPILPCPAFIHNLSLLCSALLGKTLPSEVSAFPFTPFQAGAGHSEEGAAC